MKIKKSRTLSFIALAVIYVIAAAAGTALYKMLRTPFWLSLLIADVAATVVTFIFSLIFENASVYDPYWSVQPIYILTAFALGRTLTPLGIILMIAVWFWGLRLTANWAYTFHGLMYQDWRYTMLCEKTGRAYPVINFVGIHLVPTLVVYGCILPAVFAVRESANVTAGSVIFVCLSVADAVMQGTADIQMHTFRKKGTGGFIRTGLWKHARHPNYLGEISMWWGIALSVVCAMPERWYLCAGALANTFLFLLVSIPMADGKQSKKPGFEEYKKETNKLIPIRF